MPTAGAMLQVPLMSVATFKQHPTYLDLQNLRSGDSSLADQDETLYMVLLEASTWAENYCRVPLHAHLHTDYGRIRVDNAGNLKIYPDDGPVRRVITISTGQSPGSFTQVVNSPICQIEDGLPIVMQFLGQTVTWSGPLQIGSPAPYSEIFYSMLYCAGYTATVLSAPCLANANSVTVQDPTGIYPGDQIRIWDPGSDEPLMVATGYSPVEAANPAPTAIPLSSPTQFAHAAGVTFTGLPADVHLAVAHKTVDLLQRPGQSNTSWPGARRAPQTKQSTPAPMSASEAKAMRLLDRYQDVR